jgi:hypothetical protein
MMAENQRQPGTPAIQEHPSLLPWAQFRDDMLTSREVLCKATIDAVRRFINSNPMISRRPRRKAVIEARLQLHEDLVSARFQFRRAVVRNLNRLVLTP